MDRRMRIHIDVHIRLSNPHPISGFWLAVRGWGTGLARIILCERARPKGVYSRIKLYAHRVQYNYRNAVCVLSLRLQLKCTVTCGFRMNRSNNNVM